MDPNVASHHPLRELDQAAHRNKLAGMGVVLLAALMIAGFLVSVALIRHYHDAGVEARGQLQHSLQDQVNGLVVQVKAGQDVAGQVTAACSNPKTRTLLLAEGVSCSQAAHVATATPTPAVTAQQGKQGVQGLPGGPGVGITASTIVSGNLVLSYSDGTAVDVGQITGPAGVTGKTGSGGADGRGIASTAITSSGHLTVTYTDGQTADLGSVIGPSGSSGSNGSNGAAGSNGVDGKDGATGPSGAAGPSGVAGQNGTNGSPPASFTFTVPGLTGDTQYTCTPVGDSGPGTQPAYSCAQQPTAPPTP